MNTTLFSELVDELSSVVDKPVAEKLAQAIVSAHERLLENLVLKRLGSLENAVNRLIESQQQLYAEFQEYRKQTDERFRELAEAQRRTEQRVEELAQFQQKAYAEFQEYRKQTDERFRELREAQQQMYAEFQEYRKQTDERFRELAEAQRRTEQRVEELAQFQQKAYAEFQEYRKQTDERFRELAETVRQTQEALRDLALTVKDLQKQVGGLSQTVGYVLENEAMKALPELLLRDYGLRVEGRLKRQYVQDSAGHYIEVNIFGTARRNGEQVILVGESKSQLSKNDIDRFLRRTVDALREVYPNILPIVVTHITSEPDAEDYARRLGVAVFYSYEF